MGEHRHGGFAEYVAMPTPMLLPPARRRRSRGGGRADDGASDGLADAVRQAGAAAGRERADRRASAAASPSPVCSWRSWSARGSSSRRPATRKSRAQSRWAPKAASTTRKDRVSQRDPRHERRRRRHGDRQRRRGELGRIPEVAASRRDGWSPAARRPAPIRRPTCNGCSSASSKSTDRLAEASANSASFSTSSIAGW